MSFKVRQILVFTCAGGGGGGSPAAVLGVANAPASVVQAPAAAPANAPGNSNSNNNLQSIIEKLMNFLPTGNNNFDSFVIDFLNGQLAETFGGTMKATSIMNGGKNRLNCIQYRRYIILKSILVSKGRIACGADLNCNFKQPCRWRTATETDLRFFLAEGQPKKETLDFFTGVPVMPGMS